METLIGVGLVAIGALCGGLFALPSKYAGKTPWENLWGLFFLFAAVLIPPACLIFVDNAWSTWTASTAVLLYPILFGCLWGLGSAGAALGYKLIGISLGFAIVPGVQVIFGPLIPLFVQHPEQIPTAKGLVVLLGIFASVLGVVACGYAGILRSRTSQDPAQDKNEQKPVRALMVKGLVVCVIAGVLCACLNFAFSFGLPILDKSIEVYENSAAAATLTVWIPALLGGALTACGYCISLLFKNGTWKEFRRPGIGRVILLALLMALLHDGALFFYGLGSQYLGVLGTSVGFGLLFCGMMLVGNVAGFVTGDSHGANRPSKTWIMIGLIGLVLGICTLAIGNTLN